MRCALKPILYIAALIHAAYRVWKMAKDTLADFPGGQPFGKRTTKVSFRLLLVDYRKKPSHITGLIFNITTKYPVIITKQLGEQLIEDARRIGTPGRGFKMFGLTFNKIDDPDLATRIFPAEKDPYHIFVKEDIKDMYAAFRDTIHIHSETTRLFDRMR